MEMNALDDVQDIDYLNVLQSVENVARPVTTKQRRGQRISGKDALEAAEQALSDDVQRLLTSPHTQVVSPPPSMSREATMALRALYDLLQVMIDAGDDASKYEKELEAAVKRAVTAIDPEHTFEEEKSGEEIKKEKGESATRKRKRIAGLHNPKWAEEEDSNNNMMDLDSVDDEDEGDEGDENKEMEDEYEKNKEDEDEKEN